MLRQLEALPEVQSAPAPWQLTGEGYILAVWLPNEFLDTQTFLPAAQRQSRKGGIAYVMFVDYAASPVGPYHELLFIPGSVDFDGERHLTISRIFVSSLASVVNGRANWGIPKERCDFSVQYGADGIDHVALTLDGKAIVDLTFKAGGFNLPVTTKLLPKSWCTLGQNLEGQQYFYAPDASGHVRTAKLLAAQIDGDYFPDFRRGKLLAAIRVSDFRMGFPKARLK